MRPQSVMPLSLAEFVDRLQESGRYTFTADQALRECPLSVVAFRNAALRLERQGRLTSPRRGFFVIVPLEYRSRRTPPPSWFIDELMKFQGRAYYVALLSAAALHGAAHQQPQEFQVMTDEPLRPAVAGSSRLRFFFKKRVTRTPVVPVKTETGSMTVSTPEATALDLVRYLHGAGGLGNVATVLSELAERIDPARLVAVAKIEADVAAAQRLGFLLERVGAADRTEPLARWVAERRPRTIRLRAGQEAKSAAKDARWQVLVNAPLEVAE